MLYPSNEIQSAFHIIICIDGIHGLHQLVGIDEGADSKKKGAKETPSPPCASTKRIRQVASGKLRPDSVRNTVIPNQVGYSQSQPAENEIKQAIMHGLSAVMSCGDLVDFSRNMRHDNDSINAEGNQRQDKELQQPTVRSQRNPRRIVVLY